MSTGGLAQSDVSTCICIYRPTDDDPPGFDHRLKIAMGGGPPYFKFSNGEIEGSDMQLVRLLSKKLGFLYDIVNDPNVTGEQAVELVKCC